MGFRINNNISALVAQGNLTKTQRGLANSIERLSSGLRINRGADDAAGLTISEKLRGQIRGLNRAIGNAQDGISLIQTAEGALNEDASILNRLRELAIQSQADSLTTNDRLEIQKEVDQLVDEIDRISNTTEFNTKKLLDGSASGLVSSNSRDLKAFQTGAINAGDYDVSLTLTAAGTKEVQKSAIQTDKDSGSLASLSTKLGDLASMQDANGNSLLSTPKTITLRGNGNKVDITISSDLTLQELGNKMENAITTSPSNNADGLGLKGSTFAFDATSGQFVFESGRDGSDGELSIAGDESILQGLGFQITTESADAAYRVSATQTGVSSPTTTTANTTTNTATGVVGGLALEFNLASEARLDGSVAGEDSIHISGNTDVIFTFHDTNAGGTNFQNMAAGSMTAGVTVVLTAGRTFTTASITTIVNTAIAQSNNPTHAYTVFATANGGANTASTLAVPQISASFDNGNLVLTSSVTGTSGTISLAANTIANNVLGLQTGKVTGSAGTNAILTGSVDISNGITFSGTNAADGLMSIRVGDGDFNINDQSNAASGSVTAANGHSTTDITFNRGTAISGASIVDSFNSYFTAQNVNISASMTSDGKLELRSTETGGDAKVSIASGFSGSSLAQLGFISGQNDIGAGGTAAILTGSTHDSASTVGYTLSGFMSFRVTDKNGAQSNTIYFGNGGTDANVGASESHTISKDSIISILDNVTSALGSTDVAYAFDAGNRLDFYSRSAGKESRVALSTSDTSMGTIGRNSFGIDFNTSSQGSGQTEFTIHITDGSLDFQIGANKGQQLSMQISNTSAAALRLSGLDITNIRAASRALSSIDDAVNRISSERSKLGSLQNRMTSTINNLTTTSTNLSSTESQIRDVDVAKETVDFTRNQILIQAGTAQLAQARTLGQTALQLLA